jgi:biopolymer transport protein ExbD
MKLRRHHHSVPQLTMASMPDLIFTILFFFMIVTHMRQNTIHVKYQQPEGTSLQKVTHKGAVIDIYVGKDYTSGEYKVQVNNDIVPIEDLPSHLADDRNNISSNDIEFLSASLQADKDVPMRIINKVKSALRTAHILKVNYSAKDNETILKPTQQNPH